MVGDHFDESEPVPASTSPDVAGTIGDTPLDLGYTVTVDSFSGPLDLLLYLVRRTELDILEVPLSLIVDQFVDTVRSWQDADLDVAGEFILMAATLLEMKARTIAPPLEQAEEGADDEPAFDPRESLLRSLLAYRRFKEAAQGLDTLEAARRPLLERQVREHVPEAPPEEGDFDLGEIDLSLLATTCERVLSRIGGLGPRTVVVDEMPLGVRIATMLDELAVRERTTINELLAGNHSRVVHITTVMATLELTRQRFVEVEQPEQFGEIALRLRSAEERDRVPELPPPEPDGPKRRRRLPLVTFTAPESTSAATDDDTIDATPEEPAENDEQRFLRELEEATRVTAVLAITANVEKSFTEHWYTLHPELKPVAPPVPLPAPLAELAAKRIFPKRKEVPVATPAPESPAATPATETVATIVVP
ncbi:MAG TPA: segregation/condensation protein A, partial [Planctomycetota bacterium]|nr:segregation/condensation protein A [Planctomycetota bacterium]